MDFRITGLAPETFQHFYGQTDAALAELGVLRVAVDTAPGFPDRIEMREGRVGGKRLVNPH